MKNLVARGEHQKPGAGGSGNVASPSFDNANHNALGMDPSGEGAPDFGYGPSAGGDY